MAKKNETTTVDTQNETEIVSAEQTAEAGMAEAEQPVMREFVNYSIAELFGVPVDDEMVITGLNLPGEHTPAYDENYIMRPEMLSDILAWWLIGDKDGLMLSGPSGAGKSSIIRQVCSLLRLDLRQVTGHDRLEPQELFTTIHIVDGNTCVIDGPLTYAMRYGQVFLLDEMDANLPSTNLALNDVIQSRTLTIPETGETVVAHPDFKFIATGNTNGGGDHNARFLGTMEQNTAFMDRFWVVEATYPDERTELAILKRVMPDGTPEDHLLKMIKTANDIRELFMGESDEADRIEVTMTTRTLCRWARMTAFFRGMAAKGVKPVEHALERALANRANPTTKTVIMETVRAHFG